MIRTFCKQSPSQPFVRLVSGLKKLGKTCTIVESCCGGTISSSLMKVPGSSAVYYGGSVAYNTRKSKKLLLDDKKLHAELSMKMEPESGETEGDTYIRSKLRWTAETAVAFCKQMDVDYAIAEGGAAGPTFRPEGLNKGFAAIAIAGKDSSGDVELLSQKVVHSPHADREKNMELFANAAANLASDAIGIPSQPTDGLDTKVPNGQIWLDRATALRSDESAIKDLEARSDALHVIISDGKECLFSSERELALINNVPSFYEKTFLGLDPNGTPIFAVNVAEKDASFEKLIPPGSYFANTRTSAPNLNIQHNEIVLYATAMIQWKMSHTFCSNCGSSQIPIQGGTCLKCKSCGTMSWPRQDPSIIVLVTNQAGTKVLLARSKRHPKKVHTALAGFVEAGETFEAAVLREAFEETGVLVDQSAVKYIASQPWPFPRSTMIGFHAKADDSLPLNIDTNELLSASWFDKEDVEKASKVEGLVMRHDVAEDVIKKDPNLNLLIPPKGVLARELIDKWLRDS